MSIGSLIDIGSNLTHDSFAADRDAVMARALDGRRRAPGGHRRGPGELGRRGGARGRASGAALEYGRRPSASRPRASTPRVRDELGELLRAAAGRCGRRMRPGLFPRFLAAARRSARPSSPSWRSPPRRGKPVFLHQRDAHEDFAAILRRVSRRASPAGSRIASPAAGSNSRTISRSTCRIGVTGWVSDERRGAEPARSGAAHSRRAADAGNRCALPVAARPRAAAEIAAQRAGLSAAHRAHRRALARRIAARRSAASTTRNAVRFFGLDARRRTRGLKRARDW